MFTQCLNATATPNPDELHPSSPYLPFVAQLLERIAEVDEMLELREEVDGTIRVIVSTSLIGDVIEEAHQGPVTAHEGSTKVWERLMQSYSWPGMKKDLQLQLGTSHTSDKFHNAS